MGSSQFRHTLSEVAYLGPRPIAARLRAACLASADFAGVLDDLTGVACDSMRSPEVRLAAMHACVTAAAVADWPLPPGLADELEDSRLIDTALAHGMSATLTAALRMAPADDASLKFVRVMVGRRLLAAGVRGLHVIQVLIDGGDFEAAVRAAVDDFAHRVAPALGSRPTLEQQAWARRAVSWMDELPDLVFAPLCAALRSRDLAVVLAELIGTTSFLSTSSQRAAQSLLVDRAAAN